MLYKRISLTAVAILALVIWVSASKSQANASQTDAPVTAVKTDIFTHVLSDGPHLFLPLVSRISVYSTSGHVLDSKNIPVESVTISTGNGVTTTTDANGWFTLHLIAGTYTLLPSKLNQSFNPVSLQITIPPDASEQDFTCADCGITTPEGMVNVPAGDFQMGCAPNDINCGSAEKPLHTVYLDAYDIDVHEVTNARYKACVEAGGCSAPHQSNTFFRPSYYGNAAYDNYPVLTIDWTQASTFCQWDGKRLSTEAEWEKAARGSVDTRIYPWGNTKPNCTLGNFFAWINEGVYCVMDTSAVGSSPAGASPYGVMDMAGNVWEWVNDWYQSDYYASQSSWLNPTGPASGEKRVLRGGAWDYFPPRDPYRASFRFGFPPASWNFTLPPKVVYSPIGFRCAH